MRYAESCNLRLPIGSGSTEAACKTVFIQGLKLSGMGWKFAGAQIVLKLRVILLSGIWDDVYQASAGHSNPVSIRTYAINNSLTQQFAA